MPLSSMRAPDPKTDPLARQDKDYSSARAAAFEGALCHSTV